MKWKVGLISDLRLRVTRIPRANCQAVTPKLSGYTSMKQDTGLVGFSVNQHLVCSWTNSKTRMYNFYQQVKRWQYKSRVWKMCHFLLLKVNFYYFTFDSTLVKTEMRRYPPPLPKWRDLLRFHPSRHKNCGPTPFQNVRVHAWASALMYKVIL